MKTPHEELTKQLKTRNLKHLSLGSFPRIVVAQFLVVLFSFAQGNLY